MSGRTVMLALLSFLLPAHALYGATALPAEVGKLLKRHKIPTSALSIYVQDVSSTRPVFAWRADTPRNPASTIKLLTTFAAMDVLGPAYTWETAALAHGPMRDGYLEGDLVLKGGGDPFLVTERMWKFLRELRDTGLSHIAGDLVIDDHVFSPEPEDPAAFDGKPHRSYNAQPSALLVNFQSVRFTFDPDDENRRVDITTSPRLANLTIKNRLRYTTGSCRGSFRRMKMEVQNGDAGGTVLFAGKYPEGCGRASINRVVLTPCAKAYGVFRELWEEMGGTLEGSLRIGETPEEAREIMTFESPPMSEIVRRVNKFSSNVMARTLLLTLGAEVYGEPGTYDKGRRALSDWLAMRRLDLPGLHVDNGSGLSRDTRITARVMAQLLLTAYRSPYQPEFMASLPLAGMDGTMYRRLRESPISGRAHIKTGSLDDVSASAGYVLSSAEKLYVVVVFLNHEGLRRTAAKAIQDEVLKWVYAR